MRNLLLSLFGLHVICVGALRANETQQLPQLSVEQAQDLVRDNSGRLLLDGLKSLSPKVALELARYEGWLSLDGLATISDEAAAALAQHNRALHLNGLTKISDATAAALALHRSELSLNGLTAISDEAAKALARHTGGRLFLQGLTTLSPAAARALAARNGGGPNYQLHLDGLTTLSPEAAAALATMTGHQWNGRFALRGEEVLDLEAMAAAKDKNQKIYREAPLDATGLIAFSGDPSIDGPVRDAPELLLRLAESDRVRQIFIRHVFRYFLGRNETPGDAVSLQEAEAAYLESGGSFKGLLISLLSSESFLYRTVSAEVTKQ